MQRASWKKWMGGGCDRTMSGVKPDISLMSSCLRGESTVFSCAAWWTGAATIICVTSIIMAMPSRWRRRRATTQRYGPGCEACPYGPPYEGPCL